MSLCRLSSAFTFEKGSVAIILSIPYLILAKKLSHALPIMSNDDLYRSMKSGMMEKSAPIPMPATPNLAIPAIEPTALPRPLAPAPFIALPSLRDAAMFILLLRASSLLSIASIFLRSRSCSLSWRIFCVCACVRVRSNFLTDCPNTVSPWFACRSCALDSLPSASSLTDSLRISFCNATMLCVASAVVILPSFISCVISFPHVASRWMLFSVDAPILSKTLSRSSTSSCAFFVSICTS